MEKFKEVFDSFDKDGSGNIDDVELGQAMELLGVERLDPDAVRQMIAMIDVDGDSEVGFDEFLTLMKMSGVGKSEGEEEVKIEDLVKVHACARRGGGGGGALTGLHAPRRRSAP